MPGSHLADLDCPSYRGPSTSGESLHRVFTLSDGGDDRNIPLQKPPHFSGLHKSQFCKMLKSHSNVAISTFERLSKRQAKQFSKPLQALKGLPWKIAMLIDSTLQHRARLHPENAKKFNHGKGFVIGHQWTTIVLLLNDMLIPLRPIPYYSQALLPGSSSCLSNGA